MSNAEKWFVVNKRDMIPTNSGQRFCSRDDAVELARRMSKKNMDMEYTVCRFDCGYMASSCPEHIIHY